VSLFTYTVYSIQRIGNLDSKSMFTLQYIISKALGVQNFRFKFVVYLQCIKFTGSSDSDPLFTSNLYIIKSISISDSKYFFCLQCISSKALGVQIQILCLLTM
jgi:hypothetical protein